MQKLDGGVPQQLLVLGSEVGARPPLWGTSSQCAQRRPACCHSSSVGATRWPWGNVAPRVHFPSTGGPEQRLTERQQQESNGGRSVQGRSLGMAVHHPRAALRQAQAADWLTTRRSLRVSQTQTPNLDVPPRHIEDVCNGLPPWHEHRSGWTPLRPAQS